jgi:hypothetical protein
MFDNLIFAKPALRRSRKAEIIYSVDKNIDFEQALAMLYLSRTESSPDEVSSSSGPFFFHLVFNVGDKASIRTKIFALQKTGVLFMIRHHQRQKFILLQ